MLNGVVVLLFSLTPVFGKVPEQENLDLFGLLDFRTFDWNHVANSRDDDIFTDSKIMYGTLHENILVTDFDSTKNFISYETKVQKMKIYYRFLKHLSLFKRLAIYFNWKTVKVNQPKTEERSMIRSEQPCRKTWSMEIQDFSIWKCKMNGPCSPNFSVLSHNKHKWSCLKHFFIVSNRRIIDDQLIRVLGISTIKWWFVALKSQYKW